MNFIADPINFVAEWLSSLFVKWGMLAETADFILRALGAAIVPLGAMLFTIFLIWLERKLLGRIQDRIGPNRLGPWGLFQPFADMAKIFIKEYINPIGFSWVPFNLAPVLSVASVLMLWIVIPLMPTVFVTNLNVGLLYLVGVGTFGLLSELMAGWSSNNKYSLIGAFRAVAILVSYEVPMAMVLLIPVMFAGSFTLNEIVMAQDVWFIFLMPTAALIFFITSIAEMARSPFDLLEADSELVSGFNLEYSGLKFGMFYVADFLRAFSMSLIFATVFLGGWRGPFVEQYPILGIVYLLIKTSVFYFLGLLIRGSMPRLRIDHMLDINWKYLTPMALILVMLTAVVNKLIPADTTILRVAILFLMNVVVFLAADLMVSNKLKRVKREVIKTDMRKPAATSNEQPAASLDNGAVL